MSKLLDALRRLESRITPAAQPPASPTGAPSATRHEWSSPTPSDASQPSPPVAPQPPSPEALEPSPPDAGQASSPGIGLSGVAPPAAAVVPGHAALPARAVVPGRVDRRVARRIHDQVGDRAGAVVLWMPVESVPGLDDSARRVAAALSERLGAEVAVWSSAEDSARSDASPRPAPGVRRDRCSPAELRAGHRLALVVGDPAARWPLDSSPGEYDGVYLIVELGATTRRAAAEAALRLRAAGGRLLGCIAVRPAEREAPQGTAR